MNKYDLLIKRFCRGCYYKTSKYGLINLIESILNKKLSKEEVDSFENGIYLLGPNGVDIKTNMEEIEHD